MKDLFLKALKKYNTSLVMKMIGLISFITLCIVCLANPIVWLAGNNPNSVILVRDYGNISQFVVMPNGQLSMKPKMNSMLHTTNRRFVLSTATNTPDACATLDALLNTDGSPDAINGSPDPLSALASTLDGSPNALGTLDGSPDPLDNSTCLSLLSAANSDSNLDMSGCLDSLDGSPDSLDISGSPDALGTCTNRTTRSKKMSVLGFQMPPGELLAVQSGKDIVVAISLGHNQVLMPNGTTMNLL